MDNVQTDLLLKAVGDITAALIMADKQDKIAEWTAPYVAAINEADARLAERSEPVGYIIAETLNRKREYEANGTVMYDRPLGMATMPLYTTPAEPAPRYRHVKRGTVYEVLGEAELQCAIAPPVEGDLLTIYRGTDGKLWARFRDEFHDGRFEIVPRNPT